MEEIIKKRKIEKVFHPFMEETKRIKLYNGWKKAVEKAKGWQQ
jgi:glycerol kinase